MLLGQLVRHNVAAHLTFASRQVTQVLVLARSCVAGLQDSIVI